MRSRTPLGHGDLTGANRVARHPGPIHSSASADRSPRYRVRVQGVRDLAARHGIRPTKSLGQHFLLDPNLADAIARDAGVEPGDRVVEVGAGLGSLTVALARAGAAEVLAVEVDRRLVEALEEVVADLPVVRVLQADATELDWEATLGEGPWIACGNLPYNVGTTIAIDLLERAPVARIVAMLQREVGERLAARPGDAAYGALSVRVAYRATASIVRSVPPEVFWPRPRVGSVVVRIDRRPVPAVDVDEDVLWRVVDTSFAQRRKTMRNAVRRLGLDAPHADSLLAAVGVASEARPEQLDLAAFARIGGGPAGMITELAHAKLNVFLRVLGRRPDGFHDVQTLVLPLDLADVVTIEEAASTSVRVDGPYASALAEAGGESLCRRAVAAFADATGLRTSVTVSLDKRIPVAAGLGGGSADAAAVLRALARMYEIDVRALADAAMSLGADVPAVLHGGVVFAEGRGERLTPVHAVTTQWAVLPQAFAVRATDAYAWWDESPATGPDPGALIAAFETGNLGVLSHALFDDLEPGVADRHGEIRAARDALVEAGALGAVMTGSGPTVVGLAAHLGLADRIASAVPGAFVATGPPATMDASSGVV